MKKGKAYKVKPGFSVQTRRGLVRSGGTVYESDFPPGNWDKVKRKLAEMDPDELPPEPESEPKLEPESKAAVKKTSAKKAATKKTSAKKAASKKPSFDFGRKK